MLLLEGQMDFPQARSIGTIEATCASTSCRTCRSSGATGRQGGDEVRQVPDAQADGERRCRRGARLHGHRAGAHAGSGGRRLRGTARRDGESRARSERSAAARPRQIELAKPPLTKADVTVELLAASGNLVQKVNHAGKPSMYGNNVVAMSAELNQLGAPIFEAVMKSEGAGGVRVVYDMEFAAKLPPITGHGHVDTPRSSTASSRRSTTRRTSGPRTT